MSNALAIAGVTRVLQELLHTGLIDAHVTTAIGTPVVVSALPPDRLLQDNGEPESSQLNLFLHQVAPNAAFRGTDLPTRDGRGDRVANPLLALNLRYLLTAFGAEELHGEILIGHGMQLLYENAILSREAIRNVLSNPPGGPLAPPALKALTGSDLADQVELIKIAPETLSTDDVSKLWTALQTHYRTTAAYQVSVVLIERRQPKRTPLPVLSRGMPNPTTGRDAGVAVQPSLIPPFPTIEEVALPNRQAAVRMGETVTLTGHHLGGNQIDVRVTEPRTGRTLVLSAAPGASAASVSVQIPPDPPLNPVPATSPLNPDNWQAGLYRVGVAVQATGQPERTTNELPLLLAPRIVAIAPAAAAGAVTFAVTCSPPVRASQVISLIVGDRELPAEPLAASPTSAISFIGAGFVAGTTHSIRLRVDGIESILIDQSVAPPVFDPTQTVTIP